VTTPLRIVIVALGSGGDVYPMIALGRQLSARGHDVHIVSSPSFEGRAGSAGLRFHACASRADEERALHDPDLWKMGSGFRLLFESLVELVPATYEIVRTQFIEGRTTIVANAAALGARVAREMLTGPLVTVHLQPILLRSLNHQPGIVASPAWRPVIRTIRRVLLPALDRWVLDPVITPKLNGFRATLGLPPVGRVFERWIQSPDLVLGFFPEWFAQPEDDWPPQTRLVGFPPGDDVDEHDLRDVEAFLDAGPPPVVFTAGTAMAVARPFFEASAAACRLVGCRGLVLTRYPNQLPPLPEGVRHCPYAPFARVLGRAAALVHHGGIGTIAAAFAAGVPQIVMPFNFDQPDNAARLRALGAGVTVRGPAPSAEALARAIRLAVTSPTIAEKCRSIAQATRLSDAYGTASELVETAVRTVDAGGATYAAAAPAL
jgi:rhamnosyltransferase subunit B